MRPRSRRLAFQANIDHLEDRRVLSAFGNSWPDPMHLTLSFAPDGTSDAGQSSALYQTLGKAGTTSAWQSAIVKAYQTWAASANISITVKADGGQAMGTYGAIQGDSRFGDIRIGAISQAAGVLAVTQPFSYTGGTWAGDVNFNSADLLSLDGHSGTVALYTLALHEAGHSLGLPDSTDTSSVMDDTYSGPRATGLAASDVAAIQALYGAAGDVTTNNTQSIPSTADVYTNGYVNADNGSNNTLYSGTYLNSSNAASGTFNYVYHGSLTPTDPVDFYRFTTPRQSSENVMTVSVWGLNASAIDTKVTILDHSGNPVAANVIQTEAGQLAVQVPNISLHSLYYIEVTSNATSGTGSMGNYALAIDYSSTADNPDQASSGTLTPTTTGSTTTWSAQATSSLTTQVNGVVHFMIGADTGGVDQNTAVQLTITDAGGHVVATLQANANRSRSLEIWLERGTYTLKITGINKGATSPVAMKWNLATEVLSDPMLSFGYTGGGSTGTKSPTPTPTPTPTGT